VLVVGELLAIAEAAATIDPDLAEYRERAHAAMRAGFRQLVAALHTQGALSPDVSEQHAAATIYALANDSVYLRLIDGYRWTSHDYGNWLARTLTAALTGQDTAHRP
jgi:hypothetical protein